MSQRLEIWTIAQKWMTMDENVKKEEKKNEKKERKMEKTKKTKTKLENKTAEIFFSPF